MLLLQSIFLQQLSRARLFTKILNWDAVLWLIITSAGKNSDAHNHAHSWAIYGQVH